MEQLENAKRLVICGEQTIHRYIIKQQKFRN